MTAGILNRFVRRQLCQQVPPVKTNHPQQYDMLPMESWPDSSKTGNHCYTKRNDGAPIVVRVRDQSFYVITADTEKVKVINDQSEAEQHVKIDNKGGVTLAWRKFESVQKAWDFASSIAGIAKCKSTHT